MTAVVSGIYTHGKIELLQTPVGIRDGKVRLIVIEEKPDSMLRLMTFGKYRSGKLSEPEDFAIAEWHGDSDLGGDDGK